MKLVLHNYWRSSASTRVRIGLGLKQLAFEYRIVNVIKDDQKTDAYRALNPMAQVPTLEIIEDDGTRRLLVQSIAILEYLEDRFPAPPLLPRDVHARANVRVLAEIVNAGIQPLQNSSVVRRIKQLGTDEVDWIAPYVRDGLRAYSRHAADTAGAFSVGDSPTLADCCLIPQLYAARRYKLDHEIDDRLLAIEARCLALPAFANAMPDRQIDSVPQPVTP